MQPDEVGQADLAAHAAMFHEMLVKVTDFDQFRGEIPGTDHLEGKQEYEQPFHRDKATKVHR
jgi:hypothetical protein